MLTKEHYSFEGKYYKVANIANNPRPLQARMPIIIGGGGEQRTLRIAARRADGWNVPYIGADVFAHKSRVLDDWCEKQGRDPKTIEKSVNLHFLMSSKGQQRETPFQRAGGGLSGEPQQVIDRMAEYIDGGAQRINIAIRPPVDWDALKEYVKRQMGDVAELHPELVDHAADLAAQRVVGLAMRAPAVYFDQLGNKVGPSTQAMRRWLELENATHNLDAVLEAVGAGTATEPQLDALRTMHPGVHQRLITGIMSDPDRLRTLSRRDLKKVEAVLGIPLSTSADPGFVARQQEAWSTHAQQTNTGGLTPPEPTPAQAGNTAPGNQ